MLAVCARLDELGFVDQAIDVAVLAREPQKDSSARPSASIASVDPLRRRRDIVAHLRRHVADDFTEHRLLGIEVGVEGAERDAGALRDPDDRAFGEAALTELGARGVEDLAERALAARGVRGAFPRSPDRFAPCCSASPPSSFR